MTRREQHDLNARIVWHELMLTMLVAMQAVDLWLSMGDGISVVLTYGFGLLAIVLTLRLFSMYLGTTPFGRLLTERD